MRHSTDILYSFRSRRSFSGKYNKGFRSWVVRISSQLVIFFLIKKDMMAMIAKDFLNALQFCAFELFASVV